MTRAICIHGHFYQPPRFDPWLEDVLPEGSAAPDHDWNARICRECYTPMAHARRLDGSGLVIESLNAYAWISFNFGPTLLAWMERHAPDTYQRILAADSASRRRLGHGNALAQVYHHAIMPLAPRLDKEMEVAWAIQDFQHRFGRAPQGMWLAETAVDLDTLDVLAAAGIQFTILAPRQAKAVRLPGEAEFHPVDEASLPVHQPYLVQTPGGHRISVFFYHGPVSQAVAFERLLQNGETFWQRLTAGLEAGLRAIATDGESYGHHFPFGEMALAYVIEQARSGRDRVELTNFAAYLAAHPPTAEALIHENSSWSCVHGVERWRAHCGCTTGEHPDWDQEWRRPLRRALNYVKYYVDDHYFSAMARLGAHPGNILKEYGQVLCGAWELEKLLRRHGVTDPKAQVQAARLLAMQRSALASFASCAWFFDDLARIEPLNGLTWARRALDLLAATGGPDVEEGMVRILADAHANRPGAGSGADLWEQEVTPRRPKMEELALYLSLDGGIHRGARATWPGLELHAAGHEHGTIQVQYHWPRTLERGTLALTALALARTTPHRHRLALSRILETQSEESLFQESLQQAMRLCAMLGPFDLGQRRFETDILFLAPGLAWAWLTKAAALSRERVLALRELLAANPEIRAFVERRAEAQAVRLTHDLPAQGQALVELVGRARELGLQCTWWEAQNRILEHPQRGRMLEVCQHLSVRATP